MAKGITVKSNSQSPLEANLLEVANYLYSHNYLILTVALVCTSAVMIWTTFFTQPVFTSSATVIVKIRPSNPLEPDSAVNWTRQLEIENKLYILSVFSGSLRFKKALGDDVRYLKNIGRNNSEALKAVQTIRTSLKGWEKMSPVKIGSAILSNLTFITDPTKNLIQINSKNHDPVLAQALANLASNTLVELNYQLVLREMNSVLKFVDSQTEITRQRLFALEDDLAKIQESEKILAVADIGAKIDNLQVDLKQTYSKLLLERETLRLWIDEINKSFLSFKDSIGTGVDSHVHLMQMQKRIDLLLYQKSISQSSREIASLTPDDLNASIDSTLAEFRGLFDQLRSNMTTDPWEYLGTLEKALNSAKQKLVEINAKVTAFENVKLEEVQRYKTLPNILKVITQLRRNIDVTSTLYQQLKSRLQETQIQKAGRANDLDILRVAELNMRPIGLTGWKRVLLVLVGSALAIMLLLTLRYILIPTIRNRSDLRQGGAEVIAEIPFAKVSNQKAKIKTDYPILMKLNPNSDESNAIRRARFNIQEKLNLQEARERKIPKVLTVCSASSKEGKSFVSANLAYSLAAAQFRVLLIDLDILNISLRGYFDIPFTRNNGTENQGVEGDIYFDLKPINEFLDLVDIPKAETSITDLLETPLLSDYINSLKANYDVIIMDTPPIRNSLESQIASRFSDGMIYVANQRASLRYDVYRALETLQETFHGHIFAVLNFSYDELNASRRRRRSA